MRAVDDQRIVVCRCLLFLSPTAAGESAAEHQGCCHDGKDFLELHEMTSFNRTHL